MKFLSIKIINFDLGNPDPVNPDLISTDLINKVLLFSCFLLLMSLSGFVFAENTEIYKWVDKEGNVHYAARPGDKSAVKMNKLSKRFSDKKDKTSQTDKNSMSGDQQNTEERARFCQEAKDTLKTYKLAPFLYRLDEETKQQIRLTEQETKKSFMQVEKDISYWCDTEVSENEQ